VQPLIQPPASRVEDIPAKAVTGFGLLQRDRRLENSLDLEALYHLRPSIWIEPRSSLPPGALRLLELHDEEEGHDNIGAGWLLSEPLQSGSETALRYDIRIRDDRPKPRVGILDRASAVPTRTGAAVVLRWTGVPDQGKRPWLRLTLAEGVAYRHAQVVPDGEGAWIASANIPDPRPGVWTAALVDDNQAALTEGWRFVWPRP
jgi:glucans biosynthesis protein